MQRTALDAFHYFSDHQNVAFQACHHAGLTPKAGAYTTHQKAAASHTCSTRGVHRICALLDVPKRSASMCAELAN